MRRSKIIPPAVWRDDLLRSLPLPVRWTAMGLMQIVDRDGRMVVSLTLLHQAIWGTDPTATPSDVEEHLLALDEIGFLTLYADPSDPHTTLLELTRPAREEHGKPSPLPPAPPRTTHTVDDPPLGDWCDAWETPQRAPAPAPDAAEKVLAWREREGARERERASARRDETPSPDDRPPYDPPPLGCPEHPNNTTTQRCGPCETATRQRKAYRIDYIRQWGSHWDTQV